MEGNEEKFSQKIKIQYGTETKNIIGRIHLKSGGPNKNIYFVLQKLFDTYFFIFLFH